MDAHIFWSDETETHLSNIFTQFADIPRNKFYIFGLFHYIDNNSQQQEIGPPKLGHILGGWDHYYINATGAGPNNLEYAFWNDPYNNNTVVKVYELKGYAVETVRTNVKVGTLSTQRIWNGLTVADDVMARIESRVRLFI